MSDHFTTSQNIPFVTKAPAELLALRRAYSSLVAAETQLFQQSLPKSVFERLVSKDTRRGRAQERALLVYKHLKTGALSFDTQFFATQANPRTGRFDQIRLPEVLPVKEGYELIIVEHTHPFRFTFPGGPRGGAERGPSATDYKTAQRHPSAFFIIQALPPYPAKRPEFEYFGPRVEQQ